ncbi:hypothetical protein DFP72DRAFT_389297 [Ephemerocybe angulata]|uniref:F-box domain-containing protein n=1 Tax=Ephemerocybe angulata TaxID=980116 RepID=A0A8H6HVQ4_9AGAR|nr:hypothetical protein DFP72DRAFT_389297 [Tulosesus angulatus]
MTLIPPELVDRILSLLDGEGRSAALLSCALVSSEFYATAKPAIYSDIKIGYIPYPETLEDAPRCSPPLCRLMKLASQLEHDPTPGSLVKTLHLRLEPAVDDFRASSNSSELPEDRALRPLVTLLRSLTRLEAFRIDNYALSQSFSTAKLKLVTAEVVRIRNLPTLRTLALNSCGISSRVWSQNTSLSSVILKPYSPVAPGLADTWKRLFRCLTRTQQRVPRATLLALRTSKRQ